LTRFVTSRQLVLVVDNILTNRGWRGYSRMILLDYRYLCSQYFYLQKFFSLVLGQWQGVLATTLVSSTNYR